ncbi:ATP-dependent chaperone protein ClpB, partial [Vibrio cholerae HC-62B1]
TMKCVF